MELLETIMRIASAITSISAALIVIIRPLREKLLGIKKIEEGQKCLLRAEMLSVYYRHRDTKIIRQYEYENFLYMYSAYKALGGNSFIDKIKSEIDTWEVIT